MSVEQLSVVDVVSIDKKTGQVILTISDHLDWSDSVRHQTILQAKFNKYLAFVESGEILESYPDARDRSVAIKVVFKHKPDNDGREHAQSSNCVECWLCQHKCEYHEVRDYLCRTGIRHQEW